MPRSERKASDSERRTSDSDKHKTKSRNVLKQCCLRFKKQVAGVKTQVLARAGRKTIAAHAAYNIAFGLSAMAVLIRFQGMTAVHEVRYVRGLWQHFVLLGLLLILAAYGLAVACCLGVRNPLQGKIYFFLMPLYIPFSFCFARINANMRCSCSSFFQCEALKSFTVESDMSITNPFPAPFEIRDKAFAALANMPWVNPPGLSSSSHPPGLSMSLMERHAVDVGVDVDVDSDEFEASSQNEKSHMAMVLFEKLRGKHIASSLLDSYFVSQQAGLPYLLDKNSLTFMLMRDLGSMTAQNSTRSPLYFKQVKHDEEEEEEGLVDIEAQAKMTNEVWLAYMATIKASQCTCTDSAEDGDKNCKAYHEEGESQDGPVSFWCKVDKQKKEVCKDMLEKSSGKTLWSKKLCERKKGKPSRSATIIDVKAQCACAKDMGYRMESWEKKKLNSKIKRLLVQHAEDGSTLIGNKCKAWLKEDLSLNRQWCVVGFDSACADRRLRVIDANRALRVWVSSIPCERESGLYVVLTEAREKCKRLKIILRVAIWLFYILWPFMFFLVYAWQSNRCADDSNRQSEAWGAGQAEAESEEASLEGSSHSSLTSTSSDHHSSDKSDGREAKKPTKRKQKGKSKKEDDQSEDGDKPDKNEMTKRKPTKKDDDESWLDEARGPAKSKKKKAKQDDEWSFW